MERLRILAAAAALEEFSVAELAAYSGANENTLRSVLRRERESFEEVGSEEALRRPGRPSKRYRVHDLEQIRGEIRELEDAVFSFADRASGDGEPDGDSLEDCVAAIVAAEEFVRRSWDSDVRADQLLLAKTALESLSQARQIAVEYPAFADAVAQRIQSVSVFAEFAEMEARGELLSSDRLGRAAEALAKLADVAPPERVEVFLTGLAQAAVRGGELPPLGLLAVERGDPTDTVPELAAAKWSKHSLTSGEVVWTQEWADPLVSLRLLAGVIVQDPGDDEELHESLAELAKWDLPAVVISARVDNVVAQARVAAAGALFVPLAPALNVGDVITSALHNLLGPVSSVLSDRAAAGGANTLMSGAREQAVREASQTEIVKLAERQAQNIIDEAQRQARETRLEMEDWADSILSTLELNLDKFLTAVRRGRERLQEGSHQHGVADMTPAVVDDQTELY